MATVGYSSLSCFIGFAYTKGGIIDGDSMKADALFIVSDEDFVAIVNGDEDPQQLFMEVWISPTIVNFIQGRMRVKGNMSKAS